MAKRKKHNGGHPGGENSLRYAPFCVMCGYQFPAARPDAKTGSNVCRQALKRWVKVFGREPSEPPGRTAAGKRLDGCSPPARQAEFYRSSFL